jgi:hypothetical protein
LIVEYYIHNITINFHVDDDVMGKNMPCLVGMPANDQSIALSHAVRLYWAWAPGAHFGWITFFVA